MPVDRSYTKFAELVRFLMKLDTPGCGTKNRVCVTFLDSPGRMFEILRESEDVFEAKYWSNRPGESFMKCFNEKELFVKSELNPDVFDGNVDLIGYMVQKAKLIQLFFGSKAIVTYSE